MFGVLAEYLQAGWSSRRTPRVSHMPSRGVPKAQRNTQVARAYAAHRRHATIGDKQQQQ